jgi:hypothetical protein
MKLPSLVGSSPIQMMIISNINKDEEYIDINKVSIDKIKYFSYYNE